MGPRNHHMCPYKREAETDLGQTHRGEDIHHKGERDVKMESEIGEMCLQVKDCQQPQTRR